MRRVVSLLFLSCAVGGCQTNSQSGEASVAVYEPGSPEDPFVQQALRASKQARPETTVTTSNNSHFRSKPFVISGTATSYSDSLKRVEVSQDNGVTWNPVSKSGSSWSHNFSPSAQGTYNLQFRAVDKGPDKSPATLTVVYDATAPDTTVSTPNNTAFSASIQISGSASDAAPGVLSRVEVSTNGGSSWSTVSGNTLPSWTHTFSASVDGNYTLRFRSVDRAGNVDASPASVTVVFVTPDGIRPDTTVSSPSTGSHFRTLPLAIAGAAIDTPPGVVSRVEVSTNGGTWSTVSGNTRPSWTHAFNPTSNGQYTVSFRAVDGAGNVDATPAFIEVVYDTTAPAATVSTPNGTSFTNSIVVSGSASDTAPGIVARVEVSTNNGSSWSTVSGNTTPGWTHTFSAFTGGTYTLLFRAIDKAGNVQSAPASVSLTHTPPDTTDPDTTIATATGTHFRTVPFVITGSAVDAAPGVVDEVNVSLDGGATWAPVSGSALPNWTHSFSPLSTGAYTLYFSASDTAGNTDDTPAFIDVVYDSVAPDTSVLTANNTTFAGTSFVISGSAFDAAPGLLTRIEVSTDGSTWTTVTGNSVPNWSHTLDASTDGSYTLSFRAMDQAGNVDGTPASVTVIRYTPDTIAPETTVSTASGQVVRNLPFVIGGTATDAGAGVVEAVQVSADNGATWAVVSGNTAPDWTHAFSAADGVHTLLFRAVDAAGNGDDSPASITVTVDTTAPETSVTTTSGATFTDSIQVSGVAEDAGGLARVEVSTDNGATWATVSGNTLPGWTHTFSTSTPGTYSLLFRAVDLAGNTDSSPAAFSATYPAPRVPCTPETTSRHLTTLDVTQGANDWRWPQNIGWDGDYNGNWWSDGEKVIIYNPAWPDSGMSLPIMTSFFKTFTVCANPESRVHVKAEISTPLTSPHSDTTLVVYFFDWDDHYLGAQQSSTLWKSNRTSIAIWDGWIPPGTVKIVLAPHAYLASDETNTVYYWSLSADYVAGGTETHVGVIAEEKFDTYDAATLNPLGWEELGGDWFVEPPYNFATLTNPYFYGDTASLPMTSTFKRTFPLGSYQDGDQVQLKMLFNSTLTDPTSYGKMRFYFDVGGGVTESYAISYQNYMDLFAPRVPIPAGATSATVEVEAYLGANEQRSLYVDEMVMRLIRP